MQVSVRGRVMRGRNQAAQPTHHRSSPSPVESEDFHVLTTHKATTTTTSFHHRHQASSDGPNAEGGSPPNYSSVSTLGEALHVQPTITWSPLPPRRATAAAAQSLCVTLYCDDNLDDHNRYCFKTSLSLQCWEKWTHQCLAVSHHIWRCAGKHAFCFLRLGSLLALWRPWQFTQQSSKCSRCQHSWNW